MRRGGGSRGGSFGGSRSFGGGSRSSHRRSSSRIHRTSRRHHHHRRHYRSGYYGRRYYGRRYHGGTSIVGIMIFLFFLLAIGSLIFASAVSSSSNYNNLTLAPGATYPIDYKPFSDGTVSIDVTAGSAETYIFDTEPSHIDTLEVSESHSGELFDDEYNWFSLALGQGTEVVVTWTASMPLTYYAIRGESNLESWEEGSDTQFYDDWGDTGTHTYTVNRADTYYFTLENFVFSNSYTIDFSIDIPVHDLSNANYEAVGSQVLQPDQIPGKSIILYNPSENVDTTINVEVESAFNFATVFFGSIIVVTAGLVLLYKKMKSNRSKSSSNTSNTSNTMPTRQEMDKSSKTQETEKYMTRPTATYCSNCGSGILPKSKFCIECGQSISA